MPDPNHKKHRESKMVRVHVKHGGDSGSDGQREFLYDCPATSTVDEISSDVTKISNLQSTIQHLFLQLEPLLSLHRQHHKVIALLRALSEAKSHASQDQVLHNKPLLIYALKDHVRCIETAFSTTYQIMGFPDSSLQQLLTGLELFQKDTVELLWAGKKLLRDHAQAAITWVSSCVQFSDQTLTRIVDVNTDF